MQVSDVCICTILNLVTCTILYLTWQPPLRCMFWGGVMLARLAASLLKTCVCTQFIKCGEYLPAVEVSTCSPPPPPTHTPKQGCPMASILPTPPARVGYRQSPFPPSTISSPTCQPPFAHLPTTHTATHSPHQLTYPCLPLTRPSQS